MKTTQNIKNSAYRIYAVRGGFEVWLISIASGAKLSKVSGNNILLTIEIAEEFIEWVAKQETKYI